MLARTAACLLAAAAIFAVVAACEDEPTKIKCFDIPDGGCPVGYGDACEDPTRSATYQCMPGNVWQLEAQCPAHEAGAPEDAASVDAGEASAPVFDASIDAPPGAFGGPGCETLQAPDCPLGLVLACGGCCGCEDLFVCENQGWTLWGSCSDDAGISQTGN